MENVKPESVDAPRVEELIERLEHAEPLDAADAALDVAKALERELDT